MKITLGVPYFTKRKLTKLVLFIKFKFLNAKYIMLDMPFFSYLFTTARCVSIFYRFSIILSVLVLRSLSLFSNGEVFYTCRVQFMPA